MKRILFSIAILGTLVTPIAAQAATTNPATKIISPFGVAQPGIQDPYDPLTIFPPTE